MPLVSEFYHSEFIAAADLDGRDHVVTIQACKAATIANDQGKEDARLLVRLAEFDRPMIVNKTNAIQIAKVLGGLDDTDDWTGRRITIGPSVVQAFGERREAIRVRPTVPGAHNGSAQGGTRVLGKNATARLHQRLAGLGRTLAEMIQVVREVDPGAADAIAGSHIENLDAGFGQVIADALDAMSNPERAMAAAQEDIPF